MGKRTPAANHPTVPGVGSTIFAFLIHSEPSDPMMGMFAQSVVFEDSDEEIAGKIRRNLGSEGPVDIIDPKDWAAPKIANSSQDAILAKWTEITEQAEKYLHRKASSEVSAQQLWNTGIILAKPNSGRVFCVFDSSKW
jgi:hypothetical protein